jgi:hypothetical protein
MIENTFQSMGFRLEWRECDLEDVNRKKDAK